MDETYERMRKSASRIAAVLGIERPIVERDFGLSNETRDHSHLRVKSPIRTDLSKSTERCEPDEITGTQFASVSKYFFC